jgi:DNA-directed RNA polymerase alpha subunit
MKEITESEYNNAIQLIKDYVEQENEKANQLYIKTLKYFSSVDDFSYNSGLSKIGSRILETAVRNRIKNTDLIFSDIKLHQLSEFSEKDILSIRGAGKSILQEIKTVLKKYDIYLKTN